MKGPETIEQKLDTLGKKRSEEGYMAEWKKVDNTYFLIENHCPICASANECPGFCRSELNNFKHLIGPEFNMERVEYIINNGNHCVYKIKKNDEPT
jgi:predicted ArsR family transcriptional regulator